MLRKARTKAPQSIKLQKKKIVFGMVLATYELGA